MAFFGLHPLRRSQNTFCPWCLVVSRNPVTHRGALFEINNDSVFCGLLNRHVKEILMKRIWWNFLPAEKVPIKKFFLSNTDLNGYAIVGWESSLTFSFHVMSRIHGGKVSHPVQIWWNNGRTDDVIEEWSLVFHSEWHLLVASIFFDRDLECVHCLSPSNPYLWHLDTNHPVCGCTVAQ